MDQLIELIDKIGPLLYVVVPACMAVYINLKDKLKETRINMETVDKDKRKEQYRIWVYDESRNTIKKLKELCNLYKDRGHMDLVNYLQIENGTVAASRLHNMFVSCLAEDNRYGNLPKLIMSVQRIPYNSFVEFIGEIDTSVNATAVTCPAIQEHEPVHEFGSGAIKSYMYIPIHDTEKNIVGAAAFYFHAPNFNNQDEKEYTDLIVQFKTSIEMTFFEFANNRRAKREELKLEEGDVL